MAVLCELSINLSALKSWVCIANSTTLRLRILDAATSPESIPPGFPLKFNIIAAAKGLVQTLLQCCFALKAYMVYVKYNIGRSSAYNSYLCHSNVFIYIYIITCICICICVCICVCVCIWFYDIHVNVYKVICVHGYIWRYWVGDSTLDDASKHVRTVTQGTLAIQSTMMTWCARYSSFCRWHCVFKNNTYHGCLWMYAIVAKTLI